ncbi:hypothetical protein [Dyadobacter sp. CY312]|uniref:hypothetical protein n=1 Tax=Dyadobacter sp. CY312 TaxID=2907303 RepID=UPI001F2074D5|nr:hypothetical protein [Dyadobacter sp. CY312]MCE7041138.1 hypothetical protein [Dyadobacter sp. CY312]
MKAYDELVDFLAAGTTPERVLMFKPSNESSLRVRELIQKEKIDKLNDDERSELESYFQLEHLMRLTKARAHSYVRHQ